MTAYRTVDVDGVEVFYREAGDPGAPTLLLLHGFPTSSTQYQQLIDRLSDRFHLVAPDYPGFGYTEPLEGTTTFDRLADVVDGFVHTLDLDHYGLYVFDFGAPVGFRLATRHPERVDALIVQNGNAYEAGIGPNLAGLAPYWEDRVAAEPAARTFLQLDATRAQYVEGVADPESLDPDLWTLDQHFLDLPRRDQVMLDLFYDYTSNVAPSLQRRPWRKEGAPRHVRASAVSSCAGGGTVTVGDVLRAVSAGQRKLGGRLCGAG
jgi:pimeloyl-ACP methyl ester carboxylesterase